MACSAASCRPKHGHSSVVCRYRTRLGKSLQRDRQILARYYVLARPPPNVVCRVMQARQKRQRNYDTACDDVCIAGHSQSKPCGVGVRSDRRGLPLYAPASRSCGNPEIVGRAESTCGAGKQTRARALILPASAYSSTDATRRSRPRRAWALQLGSGRVRVRVRVLVSSLCCTFRPVPKLRWVALYTQRELRAPVTRLAVFARASRRAL